MQGVKCQGEKTMIHCEKRVGLPSFIFACTNNALSTEAKIMFLSSAVGLVELPNLYYLNEK